MIDPPAVCPRLDGQLNRLFGRKSVSHLAGGASLDRPEFSPALGFGAETGPCRPSTGSLVGTSFASRYSCRERLRGMATSVFGSKDIVTQNEN